MHTLSILAGRIQQKAVLPDIRVSSFAYSAHLNLLKRCLPINKQQNADSETKSANFIF
jgi:hypothetical protein